ncbi:DIMBOA UDP-glucosyltransferase BX9-like [Triticum dicoccoides]|uniref:DIMBOA UDP-glucosyltransferase BX9-like n=1 Tax=Triticum dicoccoides TaxID=85692 RepID=UPI000E787AFE|nr:DIMBOA UDP-glucosyltransferase BX9-like [Triticum dicoccoides]
MAGGHVALFPLPFQGHLSPALQLADALHGRGLAITVLHTTFNALDPAAHPEFGFVAVADGGMPDAKDGIGKILAMNDAMEESGCVRDALAALEPRPSCLVIDTSLPAAQKAAAELGMPTVVLHTGSAAAIRLFRSYAMLHDKGYLPAQEHELDKPVKELAPIRVSDLFDPSKYPNPEMTNRLLDTATEVTDNSSGVVINTFEALETPELEAIRSELAASGVGVFAIGPLHKLSAIGGAGSSLLEADRSCIEWLDAQAAGSVLYVSFGSVAPVSREDFEEVAWGLANSGRPFLWVVRRGLVIGSGAEDVELPEGFERAAEGRGKVVRWAPQQEVLGHRAVGGFWTHSGWNSTLEGICEGVPMLCRPLFGDQLANGRYVEEVWRTGALLAGKLERGKVAEAIARFMEGDDGAAMRERAKELQIKAMEALGSAGSTQLAVDKLIDHILSL